MRCTVLLVSVLLIGGPSAALAQQAGSKDKSKDAQVAEAALAPIPEQDVEKKNPVQPTSAGLAEARKLYGYHCAMCHGKDGDGKGELAGQMTLQLNDWRDPSTIAKYTDGALFYVITNGRGKMVGGEGDRTTENVRWNLVNLVRSFGKNNEEPVKK
jgi:mono/diheme cytochrome c family protein